MDYKELLSKEEYQKILDITKDNKDPDAIIYRICALVMIKKREEALSLLIKENKIIYEKDPLMTIKMHIEMLLVDKKYDEAIKAHQDYLNRPYVSQIVEETLKEIPHQILRAKNENDTHELFLDEEKVISLFESGKDNIQLTNALYKLKKLDIAPYLKSLAHLVKRDDISDDVKTLGLLILIMKKINKDIILVKNNKEIMVNPSKLNPPYSSEEYKEIMDYIVKNSKDPTIESVAINLFNQYVLNVYPDKIFNIDSNKMAIGFIALAKLYLKEEKEVDNTIKELGGDIEEIKSIIVKFKQVIEKN